MGDHVVEDGAFINSIVGEGTRFKGELDLNGVLRIDGDYVGVIKTPDKVLVGKNGRAECTIYAGTIVIGGVVKGNIYSTEKIIILTTGMVVGNITTPRLIVEEGVVLDGECRIQKDINIEDIISEEKVETTEQEEEPAYVPPPVPDNTLYPPVPMNTQNTQNIQNPLEESAPGEERSDRPEEHKISAWNA